MIMTESFDVIIVGTEAGGGTLAGPVFVDGRYISPDAWYDPA